MHWAMGEIVNLRRARKDKARAAAEAGAQANRARSGRTKDEKQRDALETTHAKAKLDGAKRNRDDTPRRD